MARSCDAHGGGALRGPSRLLSVDQALAAVLDACTVLPAETVALDAASGRVLAEDAASDADVPPFDRCAMDGFAVRAADATAAPARLRLVGTVHAGHVFEGLVGAGECVAVMTGSPLPAGADAVVPVERSRPGEGHVEVLEAPRPGQNVSPRAEDLRRGQLALRSGDRLGAAEVALLATVSRPTVRVVSRPSLVVVPTGDELVDASEPLRPGQIRNSNGPMLACLGRDLGCDPVTLAPPVADQPEALRAALARGLEADVLLASGGVSRGERDLVGEVLASLGVRGVFHGVSIQPGKPLWCGRTDRCLVFGLPGNPVSALVTATLFAGAAVRKLRGVRDPGPRLFPARLAEPFVRHAGREGWLPARVEPAADGLRCTPIRGHGSADLVAAASATALWVAPQGRERFEAGDVVSVLLASDFAER
jgi:molybdopterin molybdotransferase